jgi:hypothetical protein
MESNYPPNGRSASFVPPWNAHKYNIRSASTEVKAKLFHVTAAKVYRIADKVLAQPGLSITFAYRRVKS